MNNQTPKFINTIINCTPFINFICCTILSNLLSVITLIWCIVIGKWYIIFLTLLNNFVLAPITIGLLLMIPTAISIPAIKLLKNEYFNWLGYIILFASLLLSSAILCLYGIGCFISALNFINDKDFLLYFLLSYVLATGPLMFMASKDDTGKAAFFSIWFSFAYLLVMIVSLFIVPNLLTIFTILLFVMIIPMSINLYNTLEENGLEYRDNII